MKLHVSTSLTALICSLKACNAVFWQSNFNSFDGKVRPASDNSHDEESGFFANERVPSLPLAVVSPYLSAWLPIGSGKAELAGRWPEFWTGHRLEWAGLIHVDEQTYAFLGESTALGYKPAKQDFYKV